MQKIHQSTRSYQIAKKSQVHFGKNMYVPAHKALGAVESVASAFGLNSNDIRFLNCLAALSDPICWESGSCPATHVSDIRLANVTGLIRSEIINFAERLSNAGLLTFELCSSDRHDAYGQAIDIYWFDFSPLVARNAEFEWLGEALIHNIDLLDQAGIGGEPLYTRM